VSVYLGILALSLRRASGGEVLGWIVGVLAGSLVFAAISITGCKYAQRRAGRVLLALPIAFPWKTHIVAASTGLILAPLLAWLSKPSAILGGTMTAACGLLFLTLVNRTALICKRGVVYVNAAFPWSAVSPVYDVCGTLRFLQLGRTWRTLCVIVPPESSNVVEAILRENASQGISATTTANAESGSDARQTVAVSTTSAKACAFPNGSE
jgi:hypothetical protein